MFALVGTVWQKEISFSRQIYDAAVRHYFTRPLLNHTFSERNQSWHLDHCQQQPGLF